MPKNQQAQRNFILNNPTMNYGMSKSAESQFSMSKITAELYTILYQKLLEFFQKNINLGDHFL